MASLVSAYPAASPEAALRHFQERLSVETDCSDVFTAMKNGDQNFVLLDVRGRNAFAQGHVPGAINLPYREITAERLAAYAEDTLFVVYCAGPHCNGANQAAVRLAQLDRPVKEMIGGITGWLDEGFALATGPDNTATVSAG